MLRDIQLPPEYAKGLETLLLKEQENDRMGVDTEIQQKQVKIAELQAEATKVQQVKQAEGEAQVHVLQAKGGSDPCDCRGGCGTNERRGRCAETESAADQQDCGGASIRQVADHDGSVGRQVFLCQ